LRFSGGAVQFRTDDCWCDVLEFERALSQSAARPTVEALEAAAALYRGPFLAGFYEDWVVIEQERLRTLYVEALEQLADLYTEQRAHRQAIATWRRVLREIPWHERAHRELMTLYALSGDRAAALHQYDEYVRILQNELDAKPLPEMRALYERLARGVPIVSPPVIELAPEVPFVGRERELNTLKALWQNVQRGQGQAIFIGGEVGVGKTTFVQKFIREGGQGVRSLQGAGYASDSALPYQPLLQAVRVALKSLPTQTLAQLPALWRGELAQFVPELQERFPDLAPNPQLPPAQGKARWFAALTGFFELLARERPLILFFRRSAVGRRRDPRIFGASCRGEECFALAGDRGLSQRRRTRRESPASMARYTRAREGVPPSDSHSTLTRRDAALARAVAGRDGTGGRARAV
jgi:tetratricopeptide (TPR) repeat protein